MAKVNLKNHRVFLCAALTVIAAANALPRKVRKNRNHVSMAL